MNLNTKKLTRFNSSDVAKLHDKAFPNFFLTSLGLSFLKLFYASISQSENQISVLLYEDEKLVGFAVGCLKNRNFYRKILISNFFSFFLSLASVFLKAPNKILTLFAKRSMPDHSVDCLPCLLSICVEPTRNGLGYGSKLIEMFEQELKKMSATSYFLTTDKQNNDSVNKFYVNNGFTLSHSFQQSSSRFLNVYIKKL